MAPSQDGAFLYLEAKLMDGAGDTSTPGENSFAGAEGSFVISDSEGANEDVVVGCPKTDGEAFGDTCFVPVKRSLSVAALQRPPPAPRGSSGLPRRPVPTPPVGGASPFAAGAARSSSNCGASASSRTCSASYGGGSPLSQRCRSGPSLPWAPPPPRTAAISVPNTCTSRAHPGPELARIAAAAFSERQRSLSARDARDPPMVWRSLNRGGSLTSRAEVSVGSLAAACTLPSSEEQGNGRSHLAPPRALQASPEFLYGRSASLGSRASADACSSREEVLQSARAPCGARPPPPCSTTIPRGCVRAASPPRMQSSPITSTSSFTCSRSAAPCGVGEAVGLVPSVSQSQVAANALQAGGCPGSPGLGAEMRARFSPSTSSLPQRRVSVARLEPEPSQPGGPASPTSGSSSPLTTYGVPRRHAARARPSSPGTTAAVPSAKGVTHAAMAPMTWKQVVPMSPKPTSPAVMFRHCASGYSSPQRVASPHLSPPRSPLLRPLSTAVLGTSLEIGRHRQLPCAADGSAAPLPPARMSTAPGALTAAAGIAAAAVVAFQPRSPSPARQPAPSSALPAPQPGTLAISAQQFPQQQQQTQPFPQPQPQPQRSPQPQQRQQQPQQPLRMFGAQPVETVSACTAIGTHEYPPPPSVPPPAYPQQPAPQRPLLQHPVKYEAHPNSVIINPPMERRARRNSTDAPPPQRRAEAHAAHRSRSAPQYWPHVAAEPLQPPVKGGSTVGGQSSTSCGGDDGMDRRDGPWWEATVQPRTSARDRDASTTPRSHGPVRPSSSRAARPGKLSL